MDKDPLSWLAKLAQDVNTHSGFYRWGESAALYCYQCKVIQAYCPGCGKKLLDVYDEERAACQHCGISLAQCGICGSPVTPQNAAPADAQPPEYWRYCPACGNSVFATTDMCPHCKVSMGAHLDAVYEETYERISRVVREEESTLEGKRKKAKPSPDSIPYSVSLDKIVAGWLTKTQLLTLRLMSRIARYIKPPTSK
jgi:hypothetical protein